MVRLAALLLVAAASLGCEYIAGYDDGRVLGPSTELESVTCQCGDPDCGDCPDTVVVALPGFSIDETEVTVEAYLGFVDADLDAQKKTHKQPNRCSENATFRPETQPLDPRMAASFVDWCDAYAFCEWRHAHLCGKMGGGTLAEAERGDPTVDEWFNACTGGSVTDPGDADPQCRSVEDFDVPLAHCHRGGGDYGKVYDLVGAVMELGDTQFLDARGSDGDVSVGCGLTARVEPLDAYGNIGFRCCQ
ncbi:MAG TPA: SUMF1/EgtB/PvdO family nonheme iron enzyme [Byssovorax sp.]